MRKPRHVFAAPLVMVAALPACLATSNPPPPQPEPVVNQPTPEPEPQPDPQPDPEPAAEDRRWSVYADASGTCFMAIEDACPGDARACNPPPPRPTACPKGLAPGDSVTIVQRAGDDVCYVVPEMGSCPQGATCNPPPPRQTACPVPQ